MNQTAPDKGLQAALAELPELATEHDIRDLQVANATLAARILALERSLPTAINDLIYVDSHRWSTRPCSTCRAVSALLRQPFGCERLAGRKVKA